MFGSPWGKVPPELEAHLRSLTNVDKAKLDEIDRLQREEKLDWWEAWDKVGGAFRGGGMGGLPEGIELVEERPGHWIWTGWQDDPEYLAYKEGLAQQRQLSAAEQVRSAGPHWGAQLPGNEGRTAMLAELFAAHDPSTATRPGSTEATRAGAIASPSTAGYLGMQSAQFAPSGRRAGLPEEG